MRGSLNTTFHPNEVHEGMLTTRGLRLIKPSIDSIPEVKWAFLTDKRFCNEKIYKEFERFMPPGFELVSPPAEQDAFTYALNLNGQMNRMKFLFELNKNYLRDRKPESGSIIAYYLEDSLEIDPIHAGIYAGNERVNSRFSLGYPVVQHPINDIPYSEFHYECYKKRS